MVQYRERENVITNSKLLPRAQLKLCRRAFLIANWIRYGVGGACCLLIGKLRSRKACYTSINWEICSTFSVSPSCKPDTGAAPRLKISSSAIWSCVGCLSSWWKSFRKWALAAHTPQCSPSKHTSSLDVFVAIEAAMRLYSEPEKNAFICVIRQKNHNSCTEVSLGCYLQ